MSYFDVVFDGPPGPESGRFIEVESPESASIAVGEWIDRGDGTWALRIPNPSTAAEPEPKPKTYPCVLCENGPIHPDCAGWHDADE